MKEKEQVPIPLSRAVSTFFNAKKIKNKLDFGDNPIYPISDLDGQDWEVWYFGGKVDFL